MAVVAVVAGLTEYFFHELIPLVEDDYCTVYKKWLDKAKSQACAFIEVGIYMHNGNTLQLQYLCRMVIKRFLEEAFDGYDL